MNAKPSSSTSKNFIQMNKEKIAKMNARPRTRSQELPLKPLPATSHLLKNSKNSGGSSKQILTMGSGDASNSTSSQPLSSGKIIEVIENTKTMIEECVKALTPIKSSQNKMSVIDEGIDSKTSQDDPQEPNEFQILNNQLKILEDEANSAKEETGLVEIDQNTPEYEPNNLKNETAFAYMKPNSPEYETNDVEEVTGIVDMKQKTPESRYKESDVHQIIYSISGSEYVSPNEKNEMQVAEESEKFENKSIEKILDNQSEHVMNFEKSKTPSKVYLNQKSVKYNTRKKSSLKAELKNSKTDEVPFEKSQMLASESESEELEKKHPELFLRRSARLAHKKEIKQKTQEKEPFRRKKSKKHAGHKKKIKY